MCNSIYREEQAVQDLGTKMLVWRSLLVNPILCILIPFWGSWSDRHYRRKPCIITAVVGNFLSSIGLILCKYFERVPVEVTTAVETIFVAFSGGYYLFSIGVYSYIADLSTEANRTFRIGILSIFMALAILGGSVSQILVQ